RSWQQEVGTMLRSIEPMRTGCDALLRFKYYHMRQSSPLAGHAAGESDHQFVVTDRDFPDLHRYSFLYCLYRRSARSQYAASGSAACCLCAVARSVLYVLGVLRQCRQRGNLRLELSATLPRPHDCPFGAGAGIAKDAVDFEAADRKSTRLN